MRLESSRTPLRSRGRSSGSPTWGWSRESLLTPAVSAGLSVGSRSRLAGWLRGSRVLRDPAPGKSAGSNVSFLPSLPCRNSSRRRSLPRCSRGSASHPVVSPFPQPPESPLPAPPRLSVCCPHLPEPGRGLGGSRGSSALGAGLCGGARGVTRLHTVPRYPGDHGGGGGHRGHQGALLWTVPGHEQERTAVRFGESDLARGQAWMGRPSPLATR